MAKARRLTATEEECQKLEQMAKSSDRREADRARGILMTLGGAKRGVIAAALRVSVDQISRWRRDYEERGVVGLAARPPGHRPAVQSTAALAVVREILAEPPPEGWVWTVPRLAEEVQRRSGVSISSSWLAVTMKKGGIVGVGRVTRSRAGKIWMKSSALGLG